MSIADRWHLPAHTHFVAVPDSVLAVLATHATPMEERVMLRMLAGWRWKDGTEATVSMRHIAKEAKVSRTTAREAIHSLTTKGLIGYWENGARKAPLISLDPLIRHASKSPFCGTRHSLKPPRAGRKNGPDSPNKLACKLGQAGLQTGPAKEAHLAQSPSLECDTQRLTTRGIPEGAREASADQGPSSRAKTPEEVQAEIAAAYADEEKRR